MTGRPPSCLCGECATCRNRVKAREAYQAMTMEERREWVARRDRTKVRASDRARYERDKPKRLAAMASMAQDPVKRRARVAVSNALRDGRLVRGVCVREGAECEGRIEAHHPDYTRPLEVVWACSMHHGELDREQRRLAIANDVCY